MTGQRRSRVRVVAGRQEHLHAGRRRERRRLDRQLRTAGSERALRDDPRRVGRGRGRARGRREDGEQRERGDPPKCRHRGLRTVSVTDASVPAGVPSRDVAVTVTITRPRRCRRAAARRDVSRTRTVTPAPGATSKATGARPRLRRQRPAAAAVVARPDRRAAQAHREAPVAVRAHRARRRAGRARARHGPAGGSSGCDDARQARPRARRRLATGAAARRWSAGTGRAACARPPPACP